MSRDVEVIGSKPPREEVHSRKVVVPWTDGGGDLTYERNEGSSFDRAGARNKQ